MDHLRVQEAGWLRLRGLSRILVYGIARSAGGECTLGKSLINMKSQLLEVNLSTNIRIWTGPGTNESPSGSNDSAIREIRTWTGTNSHKVSPIRSFLAHIYV